MKQFIKPAVVLAGYVAAFLLACGAVYVRFLRTQGDPGVQASAGMYAFGDFILFVDVFGISATVPTGLALFFLRRCRMLWLVFSIGCAALALTGVGAAAVVMLAHNVPVARNVWGELACLGVLRTLIGPVLVPGFLIAAIVAPNWPCRWILLAATLLEALAGGSWLLWMMCRPLF